MSERVFEHNGVTARLILGDCRDVLPKLGRVDAIITDPPYSEKTHAGHDVIARGNESEGNDGAKRKGLGYTFLTPADCANYGELFCQATEGWIVWMSDHSLIPPIHGALKSRYVFAPLPFFHPGCTVRLTGDGPSSWTVWITVARTPALSRWGTLPGGYVAGPGWNDKVHMGGKPTRLMQCLANDYSREGQTVCDPFMGSGSTLLACLRTGRHSIGIEIDPQHYAIACARLERECQQPVFAL